jgi:hypothetical protein
VQGPSTHSASQNGGETYFVDLVFSIFQQTFDKALSVPMRIFFADAHRPGI